MSITQIKNFLVGYYGGQIFRLTKEEAESLIHAKENEEGMIIMKDKVLSTDFSWITSKLETNILPREKGSNELLDEAVEKREIGKENFELFGTPPEDVVVPAQLDGETKP